MKAVTLTLLAVLLSISGAETPASGLQTGGAKPVAQAPAERIVWYFYTVRWGFQDEFLDLFQKNHYPILKAEMQSGRLTGIKAFTPTYHGDGRADWTFAVALTYADAAALAAPSAGPELARKLFPNQLTFRREEQRRFELLDAHWDVPLTAVDFETRELTAR